jgi:hypothetical protein
MDVFSALRSTVLAGVALVALGATAPVRADNASDLAQLPHLAPANRPSSSQRPSAPLAVTLNLANAGTWLVGQQVTSGANTGAFPWTPGDANVYTNTQGATAEGLLRLYQLTGSPALLTAAVANGQCQVNDCIAGWTYTDGSHRFATHDPLFLIELSQFSGDSQYANFVNTNFWARLTAGTYGPGSNLDAAGYANYVVSSRASQGIPELAAWDLSKLVVAAHEAGQGTAETAFMNGVLASLNAADGTHDTYDAVGLTGAIWASAVSGIDLDPTTGTWAVDNSTADLAASLLAFQAPGGGFIGSTTLTVSDTNTDVQSTGYAMLALSALNRAAYITQIRNAANYVASLQLGSGEIVEFSGATGAEDGSVESHGEALEAYADTYAGVDRWVAAPGGIDAGDCSIQADPCLTIAYAIAQAGTGNTIHIAGGTYDLGGNTAPLTVAKDGLRLVGEDPNNKPAIQRTGGTTNQALLVINGAKNVSVQDLHFVMDQTFIAEGIIANGFVDGLSIDSNDFTTLRTDGGTNSSYSKRNAISINDDNGNSQGIGLGVGSNVSITNNTISGLTDLVNGVFLRCGIDMDNGVGTISGNTITTGVHDIRVRFSTVTGASSGTTTTISGNILNGRGLEIDDPNGGSVGQITVSGNTINAITGINGNAQYPADYSIMRLMGNPQNIPVVVSGNTFAGYQGTYRGVLVENFPGTAFTNNTFTPASGAPDFVSLTISNKALNTDNPADAPLTMTFTATGNTFNGSGTAGVGRAVELLNDNDANGTAQFGAINFGDGTVANANNFDGNLRWYFHLDDYTCNTVTAAGSISVCTVPPLPDYAGDIGATGDTQVRPFTGNVSAGFNRFAGTLPDDMSTSQQNMLLAQTYDKGANPALGTVDYGFTQTRSVVYVDGTFSGTYGEAQAFPFGTAVGACAATTAYFGLNAFATISDGLLHVANAGTVCIAKGNYAEAVNITNNVQLIGDGNTAGDTVIAGAVTLNASGTDHDSPLLLQNLRTSNSAGKGVAVGTASHLAFTNVAFAGNGDSGLDFGGVSDDVVISGSLFDANVGAGLRTSTSAIVSNVTINNGTLFSNNAAGIILFGASGSGNGQISSWTIDSSQFLSNDNADTGSFGGGIWLKTGGAGSAINGFTVSNSTFADNGSVNTLNRVGITVRARPNTTMTGVNICGNTFEDTGAPGTQLTGINVFDDTANTGYQPIVVCASNTFSGLGHSISGLEQHTTRGTEPMVAFSGGVVTDWEYLSFPEAATVYVDDGFAGSVNGAGVSFVGNPGPGCGAASANYAINAFATINEALAQVQTAGTICVAPGTYAEADGSGENLVVAKAVNIYGAQYGVDARNRNDSGASIILPGVGNPGLTYSGPEQLSVVDIQAGGVTLDGFVVDGDNPAIATGLPMGAADPDVDSGIWATGSGIHIDHNVIRNLVYAGVEGYNSSTSAPATQGNTLQQNWVHNINAPSQWGIGIVVLWNYYADISDNLLDDVRIGVQTNYFFKTAPVPADARIAGNSIRASVTGIYHNYHVADVSQASPFTISGNSITADTNPAATGVWSGIFIQTLFNASSAIVSGNAIDGSGLTGRLRLGYGIGSITTSLASSLAVDGGSVAHVDYGVLATDGAYYPGQVDNYTVSNVAFSDVSIAAIAVEDTKLAGSETVNNAVKLTVGAGNTFAGDVVQEGSLSGPNAHIAYAGGASQLERMLVKAAGNNYRGGLPDYQGNVRTVDPGIINDAIADTAIGGTVTAEAGTFAQNVIMDKDVTLQGPFAGTAGFDGSRGTGEAMIQPASGVALTFKAAGATVDGMTIAGSTAGGHAITLTGANADNLTLTNSRIVNVTNGSGVSSEPGTDCTADGFAISHNLFGNITGSGASNGRGIRLGNGHCHVQIVDNTFDTMTYAVNANGGNGSVQDLTITDNRAQNTTGTAFVITKTMRTLIQRNITSATAGGLFISDAMQDFNASCNVLSASGNGISTSDFFGNTPNSGVHIFDNAISGSVDVNNGLTQNLIVGSNWYGGNPPVVTGANAFVADALPADPTDGGAFDVAACGDNTPTQIVAVSGSGQFALITNSFANPLVGRVQDALGGAVMGESMVFTPPASGASAILATASGPSDFNGVFSTTALANAIAGPYPVTLADANFGGITPASFMLTNNPATASIVLDSSTLSATYDSNPHAVTATTTPAGLAYTVTYNGSATAPTNAGTYNVVATIDDPGYSGSTSGTLTIAPKPETLTLSNLSQVYDGNPKSVTVVVSPDASVAYTVTYNGSSTPPTAVGTYSVVATVSDPNCTGTASATLTITAASAPDISVSISNGRSYVQYGKTLTNTIVVQNIGTADASGVTVGAALPATLVNGNWTCVAYTGATCGAASGSGDLSDTAVVPQNGVLVYTFSATVNDDQGLATDQVAVTATATVNGTPADSNPANNTATPPVTQIVIFRDGFEVGGDGAQNAAATTPLSSMTAASTLSLNPATAPQAPGAPQAWLRGVDANGRTVFRFDALRIGDLALMRLSVSDANGNLVPGAWLNAEQFAFGIDGKSGGYQAMLAATKGTLQMALPAWAVLPVQVFTAK